MQLSSLIGKAFKRVHMRFFSITGLETKVDNVMLITDASLVPSVAMQRHKKLEVAWGCE